MADRHQLERFLRTTLQDVGRQYEQFRQSTDEQLEDARAEYAWARHASQIPKDDSGRAKIVCRRYAEQRAARLDDAYRPACYEADHPDCEGCVEDVRDGRIETW